LFEIPHFGQSLEINARFKLLLSCLHGGALWLDPQVSIDTQLIAQITGLSIAGEDPTTLFVNKAKEKADRILKENSEVEEKAEKILKDEVKQQAE